MAKLPITFNCRRCGREYSLVMYVKAGEPPQLEKARFAFRCTNPDCREKDKLPPARIEFILRKDGTTGVSELKG